MMKRSIRLKEALRGVDDVVTPSDDYMLKTDGSLQQRPFRRRTTEDGFLDTGVEIEPERPTAFFLVGSFMESMFHEEERRFVAQLARRLPINVVNGGYSGTTTMQMTTMLIAKIGGLAKPGDVIVASLAMSDLVAATAKGSHWTDVRSHAMLNPPLKSQLEPCILHTRAALEAMAAFYGPMGLKFVLMTGPRRQSDFNTESWSRNTIADGVVRGNRRILPIWN